MSNDFRGVRIKIGELARNTGTTTDTLYVKGTNTFINVEETWGPWPEIFLT